MNRLASQFGQMPYVREFTVSLMMNVADNDIKHQVVRVVNWVKQNIKYISDPSMSEYLVSPARLIQLREAGQPAMGDCDDHVLLVNSMLASIGIPAIAVGVKLVGPEFDHVICGVMLDDQGLTLIDPCAKFSPQQTFSDKLLA